MTTAQERPKYRVITEEKDREAAAIGTVVRSASGTIACRYDQERCVLLGSRQPVEWGFLSLPLTVLWDPEDQGAAAV
ncbi:hypothetical protein [Nesterenkonia rhizosphaerae]|uniref:DUF1918 domain-containing protein n=1 Tax=Nesterenkonia rhizosphaerae TaxID=1348272 RepID=A0ABP9G9E5_9MICC